MEIFNKLMELYKEIEKVYDELKLLEFIGHKCDDNFLELINVLRNKLNRENKLISDLVKVFNNNYDSVYVFINENIDGYDDVIRKRLLDHLVMYERLYIDIDYDKSEEEIIEQEVSLKFDKLYTSCCRNLYLIYYSFLQEYIDSSNFIRLRSKLLELKYYNSFVNSDMEIQLVNNNFDINTINYIDLYFMVQFLSMDSYICDEIILDTYLDNIITSIIELLWIKDIDYNNQDKMVKSIEYQCMARAGLAMLSESGYKKVINIINNKVKELGRDNNKISMVIVDKILDVRLKDKSRVRKISMRPLKD